VVLQEETGWWLGGGDTAACNNLKLEGSGRVSYLLSSKVGGSGVVSGSLSSSLDGGGDSWGTRGDRGSHGGLLLGRRELLSRHLGGRDTVTSGGSSCRGLQRG
jgi:hypothetical protein